MKNRKEVQAQLTYFESFKKGNGYPFDKFNECMGASALKKVIEHYTSLQSIKEFIESEIKKYGDSFRNNKANMRGVADGFAINHYLWVLDAKLEEYFDENDRFIKKN